jgi:hypothetical protein
MNEQPNFQKMTRQELRAYVLKHRDDEEAMHLYMDRLHTDEDVFRFRGTYDQIGEEQFRQLVTQRTPTPQALGNE